MATQPQGILGSPRFGPSDSLATTLRACARDPTEAISKRLRDMLRVFMQHHRANAGNENSMTNELAAKCCYEAAVWYYRILEVVCNDEKKRLGDSHISGFLEHELFQRLLVVCCQEITIFSHRLPGGFPLLLQIFKLAPYDFCKVIEVILRAEEGLPPAVVGRLTQVEEAILESLAWTRDSPLWHCIRANQGPLPTCEQVMLPKYLEHPKGVNQNRDQNTSHEPTTSAKLPGVSLCPNWRGEPSSIAEQHCCPSTANRPQTSSSLCLFLRKVYHLMSRRLRKLCSKLDISDELRLKIWTCFEDSLVCHTDIMVDRHLDQLLMCAIYIMAKIANVDLPFKRIMHCYKALPRTSNSVCSKVLISETDIESHPAQNNTTDDGDHRGLFPTPDTPSAHYPEPRQGERGNLIHFYNRVYSAQMKNFALRFSPTAKGTLRDTPPLSPYPVERKASPRRHRLSSNHPVYISLLTSSSSSSSTRPHTSGLSYTFSRSPSTCLRDINNMIKRGVSPRRRSCAALQVEEGDGEDDGPAPKRFRQDGLSAWQRRLRNVANERVQRRNHDQDQTPSVTKPQPALGQR